MDSLTQATLGAAIGEWVLGKRLGNRALLWGALFGTLPDLDVMIAPLLGNATNLWWHRGPSHSLLVMIAASCALAPCLAKLWKREKISKSHAGWFVFAVWSTHVLIDCFTVYGTSVLWPFSSHRVGFNHLFIIDFFFTLPMLVALIWLAFLKSKNQLAMRRKLNAWGLGLASAYALLSVGMKFVASAGFEADLARRGVKFERRMEAPTPFNIILWRSVVDRGDEFWVGYRSIFESHETPVRWTIYPKDAAALDGMADLKETRIVKWFADGWWIARAHDQGAWIGDLRFGEGRRWTDDQGIVDHRMIFAWDLHPEARGERLQPLSSGRDGAGETLQRLFQRISGNPKTWEANPRLDGVTGRSPELLNVME
ncbi:MAG: metal-dependent hydrolase [Verrucomicrobia bacterium]|nr:MAG: metal-dependent hydrolase [Verrucomicrobiota bacterium]